MMETLQLVSKEDKASAIIAHVLCAQFKRCLLSYPFIPYKMISCYPRDIDPCKEGHSQTIAVIERPVEV